MGYAIVKNEEVLVTKFCIKKAVKIDRFPLEEFCRLFPSAAMEPVFSPFMSPFRCYPSRTVAWRAVPPAADPYIISGAVIIIIITRNPDSFRIGAFDYDFLSWFRRTDLNMDADALCKSSACGKKESI
jgi:hypothetical protein